MNERCSCRRVSAMAALMTLVLGGGSVFGQSLFQRSPGKQSQPQSTPATTAQPAGEDETPGGGVAPAQAPQAAQQVVMAEPRVDDDPNAPARAAAAQLQGYSLMVVTPPSPRKFQKHDLVEIIINENASQSIEQSLETDKKYDIKAALTQFPSLSELLKLNLKNGIGIPAELDISSESNFEGEGEAERKDRFTARIAAEVIEVKPNGNLVLEARKSIEGSGGDKTFMVLGGVCRGEDITTANTVQSSQIANLALKIEGEGDVKDAARKGYIPRVLETIFNF